MLYLSAIYKADDVAVVEHLRILYLPDNLSLAVDQLRVYAAHYKELKEEGVVVGVYNSICLGILVVFYQVLNCKPANTHIAFKNGHSFYN